MSCACTGTIDDKHNTRELNPISGVAFFVRFLCECECVCLCLCRFGEIVVCSVIDVRADADASASQGSRYCLRRRRRRRARNGPVSQPEATLLDWWRLEAAAKRAATSALKPHCYLLAGSLGAAVEVAVVAVFVVAERSATAAAGRAATGRQSVSQPAGQPVRGQWPSGGF